MSKCLEASVLEKYFDLRANNTTVKTEITAGVVAFGEYVAWL